MNQGIISHMYKAASKPKSVTAFSGRLVHSSSGWLLLEVPNALVRGAFSMLRVPGAELPPARNGRLNAHISVMRPEEMESFGGPEKVTELGKEFTFQLGNLKEVRPAGWPEMEKVWMLNVTSPELQQLRRSYGLSGKPRKGGLEMNFHVTVAVRRRKVLSASDVKKVAGEYLRALI